MAHLQAAHLRRGAASDERRAGGGVSADRALREAQDGERNGGEARRRRNGGARQFGRGQRATPAVVRVGTIGVLIGRNRTVAEREGPRRGLASSETLLMPVSRACSAKPAKAQQRRQ